MKRFFLGAVLVLVGLISGCDQYKAININESQLNDYLSKTVHYQRQFNLPGTTKANISLGNLTSQIGRKDSGKIELSTLAKVQLATVSGTVQADIELTIKGKPIFDAAKKAIFIKELEIVDGKITPEKVDIQIKTYIPSLNAALSEFFNANPVYAFNSTKNKAESTALKLAKGLEVKPGVLVIDLIKKK
ncbi:lipoprotein [Xenorhabdus anantnagensis]|uniref:Lipoprotein n=1 Tax=Xenorhabdus anantnagensis TaxID=3025875 RepID=A0ABT5LQS1_9GAMM|nr:lipoprotein [Xenorhabdus anantnagensis]MDC9596148.1 lipoprotein [Xenorhabdus anantnagensis]